MPFLIYNCNNCDVCNVCNFDAGLLFSILFPISNCNYFRRDGTLGRARKAQRVVAVDVPSLGYDSTNFLKAGSLCCVYLCTTVLSFQPFAYSVAPLLSHDRLGMPMEALLDPGRRLIQESLFGRMGFHQLCYF